MIGRLWRFLRVDSNTPRQTVPEWTLPHARREEVATDEVFYLAAARFLDVQVSTNDVFDTKTSNAFSVGSAVLPVTFGLLGLSGRRVPSETIVILAGALGSFLMLVFCVWRASRIRALSYRPNMLDLRENSVVERGDVLRRWVAEEYVTSTEFNRARLERKGVWVGRAITFLYVEGFLLSIAAVLTLR